MPTVLHTESSLGWGGQEGRLLREALGLRERGWRVIIACQPRSGILREAGRAGFQCFPLKMGGSVDPGAVRRLRKLFREQRVDLVVTHSSIDSWLSGWAASLTRPRPLVVRVRHLAGGIHTRLVYTHLCDAIVAISRDIKRHMVQNKGIRADKIEVIYSGLELERFCLPVRPAHLRGQWGVGPGDKLVGIVAVMRNKKGHRFLIRAAPRILSRHPQTKFVFVGSGPKEAEIREQISAGGLQEHFILTGSRRDIPEILNSLDIFVLPAQLEALGQAIIEAMAAGLPVVASRVGGIPELVQDGVTGLLVPAEDVRALAGAVNSLLDDPRLARRMGAQGRRFVQAEFSYRRMIDKTEAFYRRLLAGGRVRADG